MVKKFFAQSEWDEDVPEIDFVENLTKRSKLKKSGKDSIPKTVEDVVERSSNAKRKHNFDSETPKKKKKKESDSYVKFESPKIDSSMISINAVLNDVEPSPGIAIDKKKEKKQKKKTLVFIDKSSENGMASEVTEEEKIDDGKKKSKKKKGKNKKNVDESLSMGLSLDNNEEESLTIDGDKEKSKKKKDKKGKNKNNVIESHRNDEFVDDSGKEKLPVKQNDKKNKKMQSEVKIQGKSTITDGKISKNKHKKNKRREEKQLNGQRNEDKQPEVKSSGSNQQEIGAKAKSPKKSKLFVNKIKKLLEASSIPAPETIPEKENPTSDENKSMLKNLNEVQTTERPTAPKSLRERMLQRLKGARFRYLNEQMYRNDSVDASKIFKEDPDAFRAYHEGYQQQVGKWPMNPLDVIIREVAKMPKDHSIADMGCGDGRLAKSVPHKVYSFDLVAADSTINACDMAKTPLQTGQVNCVVFCLSLMGTNSKDYIAEANRVLKMGGLMKIAEVESRFENVDTFTSDLKKYGFSLVKKDFNHQLFYFMDFKKENDIKKKNKLPEVKLNPCIYKKR